MPHAAWLALLQRGKEYALNLLIAGPWAAINEKYASLDARMGGERCQETAVLCMVIGRALVEGLRQRSMLDRARRSVATYRTEHLGDKAWQDVRSVEDVNSGKPTSSAYDTLVGTAEEVVGKDKAEFLGWAYTITTFSVLSNSEVGVPIRYRRKGLVLVRTTPEQRDAGRGEYYDAEFPLRSRFSKRQCDLMLDLCDQLFPDGVTPPHLGDRPQQRDTYLEQLREVLYFSRCEKINKGHPQHPITVSSFSASGEILVKAAYKYGLVIVLDLPRFAFVKPEDDIGDESGFDTDISCGMKRTKRKGRDDITAVTYRVRRKLNIIYVPDRSKGSYRSVRAVPDEFKDSPVWKLGGYSMYRDGGHGFGLSSCDDDIFEATLRKSDVCHLISVFNFCHAEFPAGVGHPVNVSDLVKTVCGGGSTNALNRTLEYSVGWSLPADSAANPANLLEVQIVSATIARQYNLLDTVFARQLNQQGRSCFTAIAKSVPFSINHVEISTIRLEEASCFDRPSPHVQNNLAVFQHFFTIGNQLFSTSHRMKADAWMRCNNARRVMDEYLALHPDRLPLFPKETQARYIERCKAKARKEETAAKRHHPSRIASDLPMRAYSPVPTARMGPPSVCT